MNRLTLPVVAAALFVGLSGCSGSSAAPTTETPEPSPTVVHLLFPDPFDETRFDLACDDLLALGRASKAAEGFSEMSEPAAQALTEQVDDREAVRVVCRANGYRP